MSSATMPQLCLNQTMLQLRLNYARVLLLTMPLLCFDRLPICIVVGIVALGIVVALLWHSYGIGTELSISYQWICVLKFQCAPTMPFALTMPQLSLNYAKLFVGQICPNYAPTNYTPTMPSATMPQLCPVFCLNYTLTMFRCSQIIFENMICEVGIA